MQNYAFFSEETNTFSVKSSLRTNLMALFTRFWAWSSVSQDLIGEAGGRFSRPDHILSLCLFPTTGEKPSVRLPRKAHPISKTLNVKTLIGRARQAHPPYHYIYIIPITLRTLPAPDGKRSVPGPVSPTNAPVANAGKPHRCRRTRNWP